ncbi:MAG: ATP-binding cassette domain-containing protein [Opitutales bacterium]
MPTLASSARGIPPSNCSRGRTPRRRHARDLPGGAIHAVLGESGCGKTTLLRILAGLLPPDAGRIELDGQDIGALPNLRCPRSTVMGSKE